MNNETLENLKPFLYGKLLGDASLRNPKSGNSSLEIVHTTKSKDYVEHCYKRLHNFSNKIFTKKSKLIYKGEIRVYSCCGFRTKALKAMSTLRSEWYLDNGIKTLPKDLEQVFNLETLLYWYMDDGYIHHKYTNTAIVFCCEGFLESDIDRLLTILKNKFNIEGYKDKRNNSYRIRIGKKEFVNAFLSLVKPKIVLDSMLHKVRENPYRK